MCMEQNTKHAAHKTQMYRQVGRKAYTHDTSTNRIYGMYTDKRTDIRVNVHTYTYTQGKT